MIVFEKVTLQNFLSYGNDTATLNLQRKNPTLITGINHDASVNGEMDSNGCGKSSLLMAITFALYDVALGKEAEKKDNLINNINKKDLLVELEFKVKKDAYKISRYRKNKAMGGNGVKIEKNGKDITPDSIANANTFIAEEIVQVPYEIFSRIITYAANEESFLKLPLAKQRDVIEELFSYTELTKKAETLKEQIKTSKIDLKYAKDSNEEIKEEHAKHKKSVEEAEANIASWEEEHVSEIRAVETLIEKYDDFDFDKEETLIEAIKEQTDTISNYLIELNNLKENLDVAKAENSKFFGFDETKAAKIEELELKLKEYEDFSEAEFKSQLMLFAKKDELEAMLKEKRKEVRERERTQEEGLETIESLREEQKSLETSKCPYCSQEYAESQKKLKDVIKQIKEMTKALKASVKKTESLRAEVARIEEEIQDVSKLLQFSSPSEVEQYKNSRERLLEKIEDAKAEENPYTDTTDKIEKIEGEIEKRNKLIEEEKSKEIETPQFGSLKELYDTKQKFTSAVDKLDFLKGQENPYEKSLEALKGFEIKESKSGEIDELEKKIKHQEFLLKLLTKKDSFVRKALMDKYLPFLNERLRYYLGTMGLPHKAKFKSDLSMEISQFDREITFTSLSSGQKARINIALSLAFRDVLQSKHNFINLYILDECLDVGLSNVGVRKTVKLIKEVADKNKLSMFIISHRDEIKDSFKDQLEIELKNGFSKIKSP